MTDTKQDTIDRLKEERLLLSDAIDSALVALGLLDKALEGQGGTDVATD